MRKLLQAMLTLGVCGMLTALMCPALCSVVAAQSVTGVPADIEAVFDKPIYQKAMWGLRVLDLSNDKVLVDLSAHDQFYIGSVRKIFSVGALLNQIGPHHTYDTPVYRRGEVDRSGVLHGDLILVASGDLTMGGRTNPDGSVAISGYDHNEADSLGNAVLTAPDPLGGYKTIARQVAAAGIKRVAGNVVIDDRLFQPFDFRGEFEVRPIFVNDDAVDLTINPVAAGNPASVAWRPHSAAFSVNNALTTGGPASKYTLQLNPEFPLCIGVPGCAAQIAGNLPVDFAVPLTNKFPLVQTFRIVQPSNYARTVLIEELRAAGVKVDAALVAQNPVQLLPAKGTYKAGAMVAKLIGLPFSEDARLVLKVSYNIGADTSLVLWGLSRGVDNMKAALRAERINLAASYRISPNEYVFEDGSGGGSTTSTNAAVTEFLVEMSSLPTFPVFFDALPILGVDGSLGFVTDFKSDPALAGAAGQVHAKTGTMLESTSAGLVLKGQAFGGYINTRSGKKLVYELVVNNVKVNSLNDVIQVFQDEGRISSMLWRDN